MTNASSDPKVTLHVEVRDANGNVKHVETISNHPAPAGPLARLKSLFQGKE